MSPAGRTQARRLRVGSVMRMGAAVESRDLSKRYGDVHALRGFAQGLGLDPHDTNVIRAADR